jgi:hypothetical protein
MICFFPERFHINSKIEMAAAASANQCGGCCKMASLLKLGFFLATRNHLRYKKGTTNITFRYFEDSKNFNYD